MPPVLINRTPIHDDDHSGTTGTSLDNAWKQEFYDQIDQAFAALVAAGNVFGANQRIDKVRPYFEVSTPGFADRGRFGQNVGGTARLDLMANLSSDGTNVNADDTTKPSTAYLQTAGFHQFLVAFAGANPKTLTALLTLDPNGPITLHAGQLKFPAAMNASADANTLDDYEEGIWTPIIGSTGGQSGQTYANQTGAYIKVGRMVLVQFDVTLSNKGTMTGGTLQIQGLPFATVGNASGTLSYFTNLSTAFTFLTILGQGNGALVTGTTAAAGTIAVVAPSAVANITQFVGAMVYYTS